MKAWKAQDFTKISIHTLLAESDGNTLKDSVYAQIFQSTLSSQRVTKTVLENRGAALFQSTLSSQRVTFNEGCDFFIEGISIHTLLAESDTRAHQIQIKTIISIHTLLAESDSKISQMFHIIHRNFAHLSHILYIYFLF